MNYFTEVIEVVNTKKIIGFDISGVVLTLYTSANIHIISPLAALSESQIFKLFRGVISGCAMMLKPYTRGQRHRFPVLPYLRWRRWPVIEL